MNLIDVNLEKRIRKIELFLIEKLGYLEPEESLPINTDPNKTTEAPFEHVHIKTNDSHCDTIANQAPLTPLRTRDHENHGNAKWWPDKIICWKCGFNIEITEKPKMYIIYCPECNTINSLNSVLPEDYRK